MMQQQHRSGFLGSCPMNGAGTRHFMDGSRHQGTGGTGTNATPAVEK
jgi:hypothetical protein